MKKEEIMFSVIMPVHNKLPHLERSINSVLNQTYESFELLLIDDASTDGSSNKIEEFQDSRIRKFRRDIPGSGGYAARNLGIENAKGEWLAFLDADDEWSIETLQSVFLQLGSNPQAEIISFDWEMRWEGVRDERICENYDDFDLVDYLHRTDLMLTGTFVISKKLIDRVGGYPNAVECKRGGDVEAYIRWINESKKNCHFNQVLFFYYRNTVNRVTEIPNTHFCAYCTLQEIYSKTKNHRLKQEIKIFINRFVYHMLARQVKSGMAIDYKQISKMYISQYTLLKIVNLHLIRTKFLLEKLK